MAPGISASLFQTARCVWRLIAEKIEIENGPNIEVTQLLRLTHIKVETEVN